MTTIGYQDYNTENELTLWHGGDAPKFCRKCGCKLEKKEFSRGFNALTGEKRSHYKLYCPKRILWFFTHYKRMFDDDGDEII